VHEIAVQNSLQDALIKTDTPVLYMLPDVNGSYPVQKDFYNIPNCDVLKYLDKRKVAKVKLNDNTVTVYPISTWFTVRPDVKLKQVIQGHHLLQRLLEKNFQPHKVHTGSEEAFSIPLLATPAQQGTDLLQRSLPYGKEYTQIPKEEAEILLKHVTQGRVETFYHGCNALTNLKYYDGRWFYAACIRHTPNGPILHDEVQELAYTAPSKNGYTTLVPGFYKVRVTIPDNWEHIGLLPLITEKDIEYPREKKHTFTTWATTHEIGLALHQGWKIQPLERILWPETHKEPEPLKLWGDRLIRLRTEEADRLDEPFKGFIQDAARAIMLQTIGTFFRYGKEYDCYTSEPESIPIESTSELLLSGNIWKYTLPEKLSALQLQFCQPHWPMHVWGLARKKLAEKALQVPFKQLVALRSDAVWCNQEMNYEDTGKIGQFREKTLLQSSDMVWPRNNADMLKLVKKVRPNG
jgi:hypothetical protein